MTTEPETEGAKMHPLMPVQCVSFLDKKGRLRNMRYALSKKANIKRIGLLHTVQQMHSGKLNIIGGGPSLNETYTEIVGDTMVCGSAHDHAIKLGIKPDWAVECDPTLAQTKFYKENPKGTRYLVASRCDRTMFNHLKDREVYLWHMWEQDLGKPPYKGEPAFMCGATVLLAAIPVALTLGYREFHFYGVDSSFKSLDEHHAYGDVPESSQHIKVKVGDPDKGREFETTATWIGQAQQYQEMKAHWGHMFRGTFHGDGMLAEMERIAGRQA
jgi:hypothetical protein